MLQQYLPFTVLKQSMNPFADGTMDAKVATVLTVYGIETWPATTIPVPATIQVATVLTVYGIETILLQFLYP